MELAIVILDTETATLRGAPHLLELGAIRARDGEVVDRFEALVRPEVPVDPDASAFHGITEEMVQDAEPPAVVLERFRGWVGEDALAAHNADFDARVLAFECARAQIDPPPGWLIDTLRLSRRLLPDAPDHKLATLCEHLGLEEGIHHRALADAVWCWKVLEAIAERLGPQPVSLPRLVAECGAPQTIAGFHPRVRGLLKSRHRPLEQACREREEVALIYGEVGAPPATLRVRPRVLYDLGDRSYLEAECLASGLIKTYRLDRIHQVRPRP